MSGGGLQWLKIMGHFTKINSTNKQTKIKINIWMFKMVENAPKWHFTMQHRSHRKKRLCEKQQCFPWFGMIGPTADNRAFCSVLKRPSGYDADLGTRVEGEVDVPEDGRKKQEIRRRRISRNLLRSSFRALRSEAPQQRPPPPNAGTNRGPKMSETPKKASHAKWWQLA